MRRALPFLVGVLFLALVSSASARKWRDVSESFSIDAEYQRVEGEMVVLRKPDRALVKVPLLKLSKADQEFVAAQTGKPIEDSKPKTPVPMKKIMAAIEEALNQAAKGETTAQKLKYESETLAKLFDRYGKRITTFRYQIDDVVPAEKGYWLRLSVPDFRYKSKTLEVDVFGGYHHERLTEKEALILRPGGEFIIKGTIRFVLIGSRPQQLSATFAYCSSRVTGQSFLIILDECTRVIEAPPRQAVGKKTRP